MARYRVPKPFPLHDIPPDRVEGCIEQAFVEARPRLRQKLGGVCLDELFAEWSSTYEEGLRRAAGLSH
eukprot:4425308-Alexandrium_andersonii.AAC.1